MSAVNWQNSGLTAQEQQQVAQSLGFSSISDVPPPDQLTQAQLLTIQSDVPSAHEKLQSYVSQVSTPVLEPPTEEYDDAALAFALAAVSKELGELGIEIGKSGIKINKEKLAEQNENRLKELQDSIEKFAKAAKQNQANKILGWIGAALAIVAAVAILVCTCGAGAPAAVALAAVGVGIACASMTIMVLEETGVMEQFLDAFGTALGLEGDKLDKFKMGMRIGIQALLLVAGIACGFGIGSALKGIEIATKTAQIAMAVSIMTGVVGGGCAVASGGLTISSSVLSHEALEDSADAKKFLAWMAKLQAAIDQETEELKKALEQLQSMAYTWPREIMDSIRDTKFEIVGNRAEGNLA